MEDPPLRVCHLIHALSQGGAEQVLVELAHVRASTALDFSVVSLMPTEGLALPGRLRRLGIDVHPLGLPSRWDPRALVRAHGLIRDLAPDVLHSHGKHADLVGAFVARRLSIPLVSTLHLIEDAPTIVGRGKRWLAVQVRARAAVQTVAVSEALRDWYLRAFPVEPTRVVTIHNGVGPGAGSTPTTRASVRSALGIPRNAVMAIMVAMMRPGKGHAELIAAAAKIPPSLPLSLVIVGDGPLLNALEASACASSLPFRRVIFAGFREDVPALLEASDFIVHPSNSDALPTALIHGLAAGLPAVASAVGGIPEVVTRDTGLLVPPGDANALATAMACLTSDADLRRRLGIAARRRFETMFDVGLWAARLRELYQEVVA
ncbi:MAG: glycosyltransferase [Actinomycetota bacterium]|nr:glycosyltransferase [Actinomycetota bacterium]